MRPVRPMRDRVVVPTGMRVIAGVGVRLFGWLSRMYVCVAEECAVTRGW